MAFVKVAAEAELWEGDVVGRQAAGFPVLLVKLDGAIYAYEDRCAHLGVPMSEGRLDGAILTCPAHHYEYDVRTGVGVRPVTVCLTAYPLRVEDGAIYVDVSCPIRRVP